MAWRTVKGQTPSRGGGPRTRTDFGLDDLSDAVITSPSSGEVLKYNGSTWINATVPGTGDVVATAAFTTDHSLIRADTASGSKNVQQSGANTLTDAGVLTLDDGSSNQIVLTPNSAVPSMAMSGATVLSYVVASKLLTIAPATGSGSTVNITPGYTSGAATVNLKNVTTSQATTVNVGSDAAGGTGTINVDNVTATRTNGDLTLSANGTGRVSFNNSRVYDVIVQDTHFIYVQNPTSSERMELRLITAPNFMVEAMYATIAGGTDLTIELGKINWNATFAASPTSILDAPLVATTSGVSKTSTFTNIDGSATPQILVMTTTAATGTSTDLRIGIKYRMERE